MDTQHSINLQQGLIENMQSNNKRQFDISKSKFLRLVLDEYIKRKEIAEFMKKKK